ISRQQESPVKKASEVFQHSHIHYQYYFQFPLYFLVLDQSRTGKFVRLYTTSSYKHELFKTRPRISHPSGSSPSFSNGDLPVPNCKPISLP
ncbi:hypothetical protein AMECASPLE_007349, partial [Ameca splendens]